MFVDRLSLLEYENGKLQTKDMGRFDIFFHERDIQNLVDPEVAYATDRFMGCTDMESLQRIGWLPEDKIHIRLETPRNAEEDAKVAELQLDMGGDLYFKIWNSTALQQYVPREFEATEPFVTSDPSRRLAYVGIKAFCFHQLADLANELSRTR